MSDTLTLLPAIGEAISNNGQYWQDPLYLHSSGGNYHWFGSNSGYSWAADGSYQMVVFAFNDSIDETTSFQNGAFTEWTTEGSVYFGFRYDDAGSYYYGWLHGTLTDGVGFHFDQFAISSTAGATVYAGIDPDLAAIPEPSTTALLFGVVAAGVMFWRRRRSRLAAAVRS